MSLNELSISKFILLISDARCFSTYRDGSANYHALNGLSRTANRRSDREIPNEHCERILDRSSPYKIHELHLLFGPRRGTISDIPTTAHRYNAHASPVTSVTLRAKCLFYASHKKPKIKVCFGMSSGHGSARVTRAAVSHERRRKVKGTASQLPQRRGRLFNLSMLL